MNTHRPSITVRKPTTKIQISSSKINFFPVTLSFPSSCFIELCQSSDVLATDRLFIPKQYFRTSVVALYHEAHTNSNLHREFGLRAKLQEIKRFFPSHDSWDASLWDSEVKIQGFFWHLKADNSILWHLLWLKQASGQEHLDYACSWGCTHLIFIHL